MKLATILCALLVLAGTAGADGEARSTAVLLAARAELPDPNFRDSVVLVMNNVAPVPMGIILNRPTRVDVARAFPDIERLATRGDKLYFGGPVNPGVVSFVFRADKPREHAVPVAEGTWFSMNEELLRELLARENPMEGLRVFVGYAGWSRGQLEAEIANGDWKLRPVTPEAIFDAGPEHPWPDRHEPRREQRG